MQKTNQKRIPRTQADVDRAFMDGMNVGMEITIDLFMTVLLDKHNATQAEIDVLAVELESLCDSIDKGYINYVDLRNTLREDYHFKIAPLKRKVR